MNIAIIPARSGSQRIPQKNVRLFNGKPIIAYSIEAAINSKLFDDVIVSTDSQDIAQLAKSYGASVPWLRPKELADHYTATLPVIQHAIEAYDRKNTTEFVCCIYATAPFVSAKLLQLAYKKIMQSNAAYCLPICEFDYPIQRALNLSSEQRISMAQTEYMKTRSQDLSACYHDVGQFYFGRINSWLSGDDILGEQSMGIVIPRSHALDIDTEEDWLIAEAIHKQVLK